MAGCTSLCSSHPSTHLKSQTSQSDLNWGYLLRHQFNMELLPCFYCNDQLRISTSETSGGWFTGSKHSPGQAALVGRPACCARLTHHHGAGRAPSCLAAQHRPLLSARGELWAGGLLGAWGNTRAPCFATQLHLKAPEPGEVPSAALTTRAAWGRTHSLFFWVFLKQIFV